MNGWTEYDGFQPPTGGPQGPPQPGIGERGLRQPGGQPLPWSYYQRLAGKIGVPESFWDWIGQGYPIRPSWQSRAEQTRPRADLETPYSGYFTGDIVSRAPFFKPTYRHELGHHMDVMTGADGPTSQRPEWQQAIERWKDDPQYPWGEYLWTYITGGHPSGSGGQPAWHEAYARAADYPFTQVPRYVRGFYPWRDWAEEEATAKRSQARPMTNGQLNELYDRLRTQQGARR